jgi:catechol 2,3-dioxygenase-like lactoylglutathione lyase family enzyme
MKPYDALASPCVAWVMVLACTLLSGSVHAADAAAVPEVALKRVNLLVRDLDRSLAVYRDILGFRNAQVSQSSPQSYSYPVFRLPAQARLRFCTLDSATEIRALALTEVTGIELPAPGPIVTSSPVIRVEDFDAVHARLKAAGLVVLYELD